MVEELNILQAGLSLSRSVQGRWVTLNARCAVLSIVGDRSGWMDPAHLP